MQHSLNNSTSFQSAVWYILTIMENIFQKKKKKVQIPIRQAKVLIEGEDWREAQVDVRLLAIPAFDCIAGLCNRHLNSNQRFEVKLRALTHCAFLNLSNHNAFFNKATQSTVALLFRSGFSNNSESTDNSLASISDVQTPQFPCEERCFDRGTQFILGRKMLYNMLQFAK